MRCEPFLSGLWLMKCACPQAAESITKISAVMSPAQIEQYCLPLLNRLAHGEWFTSRTSSCALFPSTYDKVSPQLQDELRRSFAALGTDETPMVRRAAARWLGVCSSLLYVVYTIF